MARNNKTEMTLSELGELLGVRKDGSGDFLARVFGPVREVASTVINPIPPDEAQQHLGLRAIEEIDLRAIMRDVGLVVAREVARSLSTMALRPADFTEVPDLSEYIAAKVALTLSEVPEEFRTSFLQSLQNKG